MGAQKKIHEEFDINGQRAHLVRQDRIECDPDRHILEYPNGKKCKVVNFSAFGLAVESPVSSEDIYENCRFLVDGHPISEITISKVRESKNILGGYSIAYTITGDPLDVDSVIAIKQLNEILVENAQSVQKDYELNPEFKTLVLEIRDILLKLQDEINSMDKNAYSGEVYSLNHYHDTISNRVSTYFSQTLSPIYGRLKESVNGLSEEQLRIHFEYFRKKVGETMYQSAYAKRAYTKPKGYAGDYEMMNHVYKRDLRGDTLFAKCLQRYFVDEPAGRAVRNREKYLRRKIEKIIGKGKIKILSVASGPAMEIQNLVANKENNISEVEFHLLDQDIDALKHAQRKIIENARTNKKNVHLTLHHLAIKNVIQEGLPVSDFDLIYSAGLFDYFTDPVAIYAANQLAKSLKPGGNLIVGNFSLNNPNQFAMGLIMDWNLIYRSESKMSELFSKIGSDFSLENEEQGINLFANIRK